MALTLPIGRAEEEEEAISAAFILSFRDVITSSSDSLGK